MVKLQVSKKKSTPVRCACAPGPDDEEIAVPFVLVSRRDRRQVQTVLDYMNFLGRVSGRKHPLSYREDRRFFGSDFYVKGLRKDVREFRDFLRCCRIL
jgi:hypothetical protein